jgi:polyisoprenyl-teichoic acid--peptidoglycan teichoic acid transferase
MNQKQGNLINKKKIAWQRIVFWSISLILSVATFFFVRRLTACWQLTALPGIPPTYCGAESVDTTGLPAPGLEGTPGTNIPVDLATPEVDLAAPEVDLPRWDGASRINIVFFGLRGGDTGDDDCPLCTDTIILMTIDPVTRTAGMLSILRDLWVDIPGFDYSRINTAWTLGEAAKLPGGGPGLAMETVSQFIGVPVHYYVQVDFDTFVDMIDLIGGVDVYIDRTYFLDPVVHGKELKKVKLTCCDERHLNGAVALAYARCRYESQGCADGDVGRMKRQQQVILSIRDKVFDPAYFPQLLAQAPQLYTTFSSGIHTNMTIEDAIKLAVLAKDIPIASIKQRVIDNNMAIFANVTLNGVPSSVLRPMPELIRLVRDEIFVPGGPASPLAQEDLTTLMQADEARIRVTNNTNTADLDGRTANFLMAQGMQVTERGVPTGASNQTMLILYSPKLYALRYLINTFGIQGSNQIIMQHDPTATVDIEIRIGEDWISKLPSGY